MHTILQIIEFVKKSYGEELLELTDEQILGCIPSDFIIKLDGEEIDDITRIFADAARLRVLEQANCGKKRVMFDNDKWLKSAPWTEINNLFEKLNFNYRFSDDYEYDIPKPIIKEVSREEYRELEILQSHIMKKLKIHLKD